MKKFKYIAFSFLLAGSTALTGCLDEEPLYTFNGNVIFATSSNAKQALLGCYGYLAAPDAYGQQWQELPISASGFAWTNRGGGEDGNVSLNVSISSTQVDYAWRGMYKVIGEVNTFLDYLKKSPIPETEKKQLEAEARFLRGVAYLNLVTLFGDVPMRDYPTTIDAVPLARTPKEQVFGLILSDFEAAQILPLPGKDSDGYATGLAAKAYLGKVHHKMACLGIDKDKNLNAAKGYFDEVYGKYKLQPKYQDLFVDHVNGSQESIFQLNYNSESTVVFNRACNRFAPAHSTKGIAWGTYKSTKALYDWMKATYPNDPRLETSFLTEWRNGQNNQGPKPLKGDEPCANDSVYAYPYTTYTVPGDFVYKTNPKTGRKEVVKESGKELLRQYVVKMPYADMGDNQMNPDPAKLAKFIEQAEAMNPNKKHGLLTPEQRKDSCRLARMGRIVEDVFAASGQEHASPYFKKMFDPNAVGQRSHKNLIVYRYAEMLLLMADVYNELGDKDKAVDLANEVLTRARQSGDGIEPKNWDKNTLNQDQVREKLYNERIFEFVGEPNMYDMVRLKGTDFLKKALTVHNEHKITILSAETYQETKNNKQDRLYNEDEGAVLTPEFLKRNLLLPIPLTEINYNEAISVNDNNYGY